MTAVDVILEGRELRKEFDVAAGKLHAVDGVTFQIQRGRTLGVVGESGCGKSTLGQLLLGLTGVSGGRILFKGEDVTHAKGVRRRALRREMQMIFQDPMSSLDPRLCAMELIAEPLQIYKVCPSRAALEERVRGLME